MKEMQAKISIKITGRLFFHLGKSPHTFKSNLRMLFIKGAFLSFGKHTDIDSDVVFEHPDKIIIVIYRQMGITIGNNSGMAGLSFVVASNHTFDETDRSKPYRLQAVSNKGITIGENVWGASSVLILDGGTIGNDVTI